MIPPTPEERAEVIEAARAELAAMVAELKTPAERAQLLDSADDLIDAVRKIVGELRVVERKAAGSRCLCGSGQPFETCSSNHFYPGMMDPNNWRNRSGVKL